jgi:rsbT co-antagonist protein RsbR
MSSVEQLTEELHTLRRRVAELEQQAADAQNTELALRQKTLEQEALLHAIPALVFMKGRDHRYITVNQAYAQSYGLSIEQIVGKTDGDIFSPDVAAAYQANDEQVMSSGQPRVNVELPIDLADGGSGWLSEQDIPLRDASGTVIGMVGVAIDITARKQAETALRQSEATMREVIEQQDKLITTIRELSSPVIPIYDRIVALPLVGHIDSSRGKQITEELLNSVQKHGAEFVIIDITGVAVIDIVVANHLIQATQAARLLGAQCILVGISPEVAQTLAQLDVNLATVITSNNLQGGITYALARQGRAIVPIRARPSTSL